MLGFIVLAFGEVKIMVATSWNNRRDKYENRVNSGQTTSPISVSVVPFYCVCGAVFPVGSKCQIP
jgi:hypothetical protein